MDFRGIQQSFQLRKSLRGPPEGEITDIFLLKKFAEIQQIALLKFSEI